MTCLLGWLFPFSSQMVSYALYRSVLGWVDSILYLAEQIHYSTPDVFNFTYVLFLENLFIIYIGILYYITLLIHFIFSQNL